MTGLIPGEIRVNGFPAGAGDCARMAAKSSADAVSGSLLCDRLREEILPSWQNLAHGADLHGDMFDTVEDRAVRAAENDIAVFSHQFDDKQLAAEVTHLVRCSISK